MTDVRTRLYIEANAVCATHQSGVGHAVQSMITALRRHPELHPRHRVVLITPLRGAGLLQQRGLGGVARVTMPLPLRGYDRWAALPRLPPLDVLLGRGTFVFPNFGNWPLRTSPSLTFIHDLAFMRLPETVEARTAARLRANARRWTARASLVVTPSEFSKREAIDCLGLPHDRVAVVPWGVDRDVFHPRNAEDVRSTLTRLRLPQNYILYVGNIEPRKNLARLVRAYGRLDGRLRREHALVLVGGTSWRAEEIDLEIARATARGDRVVRVRERVSDEDLPAVLSGAALLAHPALYEGFGLVPLQAMACGTPVLVGDRSAMPEVVAAAGVHVDPLREDHIAERITAMLTHSSLRSTLVEAGTARAAAFSWARSVAALMRAVASVER